MTPEHELMLILARARDRDHDELTATAGPGTIAQNLLTMWPHAPAAQIFRYQGRPVAFCAFFAMTPVCLSVGMIATPEFPRVARELIRWGKEAKPRLLSLGFRRAECRAIEGHDDAVRLLNHLGFVAEARIPDFGRNGETFVQFAWRASDHVLYAENSKPAGDAAERRRRRRGIA